MDIREFVPATGRGEWQASLYDQAGRAVRQNSDGAQEQLVQASSLADRECGDLAVAPDVHVKNVIPEDGDVGRTGTGGEDASQPAAADRVQRITLVRARLSSGSAAEPLREDQARGWDNRRDQAGERASAAHGGETRSDGRSVGMRRTRGGESGGRIFRVVRGGGRVPPR